MSIETADRWALSSEGLELLLDAAVEVCVLVEADGRIAGWNRAAEAMFGWTAGEAIGVDMVGLLLPQDVRGEYGAAVERLLASVSRVGTRFELRAVCRDGVEVLVEVALCVVDSGPRPRIAALMVDVSDRKGAAARQRQFEAIVASSGDAILSGPFDGTLESWNPAAERLYGYTAAEMIGGSVTRLLPGGTFDDVEPQRQALREGRSIFLETEERRKDGSLVDVAVTISPLRDDAGDVAGVVSVVRDVTERNQAAKQLAEAHSRFAAAFDAASIGMALVAPNGRFLEVNPALCALLDRDADTMLASSFQEITHPDDLAEGIYEVKRALAGEIDTFQQAKRYLLPGGGIVWGLLTLTLVRDSDGVPRHFVVQIQDITGQKTAEGELRRYATQLEALSGKDPLTGLLNQRAFEAAAGEELRALDAGGEACTIVIAEVDGDDDAVALASASLVGTSRDSDQLAHLGDGELAILLRNVDPPAAGPVLARIRGALGGNIRTAYATGRPGDSVGALLGQIRGILANDTDSPARPGQAPVGIARLLELARRQLGMPVSFLTHVDGEDYVFASVSAEEEQLKALEGTTTTLSDTYCQRMLDRRIGSTVADLATDPETRDLDTTTQLGLRAYAGVPVRLRSGEIYGTLCTIDTQPHSELSERHTELLEFLSELAGEVIEDEAQQHAARRAETRASGVRTLLVALEARDLYTGEHSKQVVALATAVSRRLGLDPDATSDVEQVALLHDVGKVGIPDVILQKQGPLDEQECQLMRQHPIVGEHIIAGTPGLSHLAPAMRAEHERWDGNGYPDGLAGESIPLASRITLACDAWNAMTSDRPYRPTMTRQRARAELQANAGTQFDPDVIEALLAEIAVPVTSLQNDSAQRPRNEIAEPAQPA